MIANTSSSSSLPGMLTISGNEVHTPRYVVTVGKDRVLITDPATGKTIEAYGDPHVKTSDDDRMQFQRDNLTIDLPDGTKITIVPTRAKDGVSYVGSVQVMCGNDVTTIHGIHSDRGPVMGRVSQNAAVQDPVYDDGTVLHVRGELDDLFTSDGREIRGSDFSQRFGEHMLDGLGGTSRTKLGGRSTGGGIYDSMLDSIDALYAKLYAKMAELDGVDAQSSEMNRLMTDIQMIQMHIQQMMQTLTNVMKSQHDTMMAVARNIA